MMSVFVGFIIWAGRYAYHFFGLNGTGPYYGFWSGAGSDITELGVIGAIWRGINCHERRCWRLGHNYRGMRVCHQHRHKNRMYSG